MYFGDWLRSSEIKHVWYLSFRSPDPDFAKRINEALKKNGQVQRISTTTLMIESLEPKGPVVKKLRKAVTSEDEVVFFFPHHKLVGHQLITPWGED